MYDEEQEDAQHLLEWRINKYIEHNLPNHEERDGNLKDLIVHDDVESRSEEGAKLIFLDNDCDEKIESIEVSIMCDSDERTSEDEYETVGDEGDHDGDGDRDGEVNNDEDVEENTNADRKGEGDGDVDHESDSDDYDDEVYNMDANNDKDEKDDMIVTVDPQIRHGLDKPWRPRDSGCANAR